MDSEMPYFLSFGHYHQAPGASCGILHCKNVMVISTLSGLSQLHLFRGFYSSPHHAVLSGLNDPYSSYLGWLEVF